MASIYQLKPAFQRFLTPLLHTLRSWGVTPNQLTVAAMVLSALGGALLWWGYPEKVALLSLPLVCFVRMALNALDGMMARQYQLSSSLGQVLNELGDVLSDAVLYFPLAIYLQADPPAQVMLFAFVYFGLLCEFAGLLAQAMIGERRYDGPMGKSDRAFLMGSLALALVLWPPVVEAMTGILGIATVLLIWSTLNRLKPCVKTSGEG